MTAATLFTPTRPPQFDEGFTIADLDHHSLESHRHSMEYDEVNDEMDEAMDVAADSAEQSADELALFPHAACLSDLLTFSHCPTVPSWR